MADESYFLRREGWKILEMKDCPKGFPLEVEVTFLVGKGKPGKYRVAWIDQSGVLKTLDNFSLKNGCLQATITVGDEKWALSGEPRTKGGKPGLAGHIVVKKGTRPKSSAKVGYEGGAGTWHAEGNGGGGGVVGLAEVKQVVKAAGTKLKKAVRG